MPRRRMIAPAFWTSKKFFLRILRACQWVCQFKTRSVLFRFARDVRLFFIGLWNFADDEGRFIYDLVQLKGQIVPFDEDFTLKKIKTVIQVLEKAKRIFIYEVESVSYGYIVNFKKHQTINRPTASTLPPPPKDKFNEWLNESSVSDSGVTHAQEKLREVKLNKKTFLPSASKLSTTFPQSKSNPTQIGSLLSEFLEKGTAALNRKEKLEEFKSEILKVCRRFIYHQEKVWGYKISDSKKYINEIFGQMINLTIYRQLRAPGDKKENPIDPQKIIGIIERLKKPPRKGQKAAMPYLAWAVANESKVR